MLFFSKIKNNIYIKIIILKMSSAEIFTQHAKC